MRMKPSKLLAATGIALLFAQNAHAALIIRTGPAVFTQATAIAIGSKTTVEGKIAGQTVTFDSVLPGERYDVVLHNAAGDKWRLVDMNWYAQVPPDPNQKPEALSDDDRAALQTILAEIKTFTNKNTFLQVRGDSQRAVALVELYRDVDFHARKGDEIIWRIEVWYFENQAGGWAKVQQQNRVVERERFSSAEAFEKRRKPLKWVGIEEGMRIERGKDTVVDLEKATKAGTRPPP